MPSLAVTQCLLVLIFLFFVPCPTVGRRCPRLRGKFGGKIMFNFDSNLNNTYVNLAAHIKSRLVSLQAVREANISFENFPRVPLYTTETVLDGYKSSLDAKNVLLVFGGNDYYGIKLATQRINTTFSNYMMNYLQIFEFPPMLRIKILERIYSWIRKNDKHTMQTIFILDAKYVKNNIPWKKIEVMSDILREVDVSLRFIYYHNNPSEIATKIRTSNVNDVVLMISGDATKKLLTAAKANDLLDWKLRWLILLPITSQLDIGNIGFEAESTNITFVQFASPHDIKSTRVPVPDAFSSVVYDSLDITYAILEGLALHVNGDKPITGLTGNITIDFSKLCDDSPTDSALRRTWTMYIFEGVGRQAKRVGHISGTPPAGANAVGTITDFTMPEPKLKDLSNEAVLSDLNSTVFRIMTVIEPPFAMYKANHSRIANVNDKLEGLVIDIVKILMQRLNISYSIQLDHSGVYGALKADGQWSGVIGRIMNGDADMAAMAFYITDQRKKVVNYLSHFYRFKGAVLLKENTQEGITAMFQFLMPFTVEVWAVTIGSMVFVGIVLAIINCISPNKTNYNLYESLFFSLGSLFQGVTSTPPNKTSGRILVSIWWFFSLMLVIIYIINYAVFRTKNNYQITVNSLKDLPNQNQYEYGTVKGTHYETIFQSSNLEYMQKMNKMMRQEFKNGLVNDYATALNLVKGGNYAFIYDNVITRYSAYYSCLKETAYFDNNNYAFVTQKSVAYQDLFDQEIRKMRTDNTITNLVKKHLPYIHDSTLVNPNCQNLGFFGFIQKYLPKSISQYSSSQALNLNQMLGIFLIMIFGCIISLILALFECGFKRCCQKYTERRGKQYVGGRGGSNGESRA